MLRRLLLQLLREAGHPDVVQWVLGVLRGLFQLRGAAVAG